MTPAHDGAPGGEHRGGLPYAAQLRVYAPLASFPEPERRRWERYADGAGAPDQVTAMVREHAAGLAALLGVPPPTVPTAEPDEALVMTRQGGLLVCPLRLRLRAWEALADFRSGLPDEVWSAFVPVQVADDAERLLEAWLVDHPKVLAHVLTSPWRVPLPWLLLVSPDERELVLGPRSAGAVPVRGPAGRPRSCRYTVAMADARRRVARALAVLRRAVADGPAIMAVEDVARWLEDFHPHAVVELDYGGLVHLLDDDTLRDDDSPQLLARAVAALGDGDTAAATEAYTTVVERWHRLEACGVAS